jgi:hypothetical protein
MLTCHLMGGLGNQLFQIFATISNAIRTKQRFTFLYSESLGANGDTIRSTYWKNLFVRLKPFLTNFLPQPMNIIREESFCYKQPNVPTEGNNCIVGYFQSYKYFEDNYETICKMIGIQKLKNDYPVQEHTISLHFRIGDYKKVQHFHPIMPFEYYTNSISHILCESTESYDGTTPTYKILYFCENQDIDDVDIILDRLKTEYPTIVFTKASNDIADWGQMLTMSNCQHNIIANSSFSWWGAYFNNNPNKIVCYPSTWFGECAGNNTIDLCPREWKCIGST